MPHYPKPYHTLCQTQKEDIPKLGFLFTAYEQYGADIQEYLNPLFDLNTPFLFLSVSLIVVATNSRISAFPHVFFSLMCCAIGRLVIRHKMGCELFKEISHKESWRLENGCRPPTSANFSSEEEPYTSNNLKLRMHMYLKKKNYTQPSGAMKL